MGLEYLIGMVWMAVVFLALALYTRYEMRKLSSMTPGNRFTLVLLHEQSLYCMAVFIGLGFVSLPVIIALVAVLALLIPRWVRQYILTRVAIDARNAALAAQGRS